MRNEHFGISVVELMAAGTIVVAHDSGGPRMDIIREGETGFLATDAEEYARQMARVIRMDESSLEAMRTAARDDVIRFSDQSFKRDFARLFKGFVASS